MKNLNTFYTELKAAGALTTEFADAAKNGTIAEFLKANDVDATAEEFMAVAQAEINDDQLEAVAGGANFLEAMLSIFTVGLGCALHVVASLSGDGVGNGPDGALLCNDEGSVDIIQKTFEEF